MDLEEYIKDAKPMGKFTPKPFYCEEGNYIKVFWSDEPSYAQEVSPEVTIFKSFETDEVVGSQIPRIRQLISR